MLKETAEPDRIERALAAQGSGRNRVHEQLPWLSRLPLTSGVILDVGCGAGYHCEYFKSRGLNPVGNDFYADAFQFHGQIPFLNCDFTQLPGEAYDAVFASHVLEHCPNMRATLMAWRRLVKEDGLLIVIVPRYSPLVVNDHWITGWNVGQLAAVLASVGFDCRESIFAQLGIHVCGYGRKIAVPDNAMHVPSIMQYLPAGLRNRHLVQNGNDFLDGLVAFAEGDLCTPASVEFHAGHTAFSLAANRDLSLNGEEWRDLTRHFGTAGIDLRAAALTMLVVLEGEPCGLRLAVGTGSDIDLFADCADIWWSLSPGINVFTFRMSDMRVLRGAPDYRHIRSIHFGGQARNARLKVWLNDSRGESLL